MVKFYETPDWQGFDCVLEGLGVIWGRIGQSGSGVLLQLFIGK